MKSKIIILIILAIQICGAITFTAVNAKYLYGTTDNLFYLWRYGAFSLIGIAAGIICSFIPLEKIDRFFNKAVKWTFVTIVILAVLLYLFDLFFYYDHGLVLKERILVWLDPDAYANSNGYIIMINRQIREGAQLFGGRDIGFIKLFVNDMILSYMIGTSGWVLFGAVILLSTLLVLKMSTESFKIEIPICRFIAMTIWIYIAVSFLWNIAMVFNIMPLTNSHFPFLSYDRSSLVFDMCLMGIFIRMATVGGKSNFVR